MSDLILASVYSPTETINGYTQDKLGDEWWKTVYKIPAEVHFGTTQDQEDSRGRRGSAEKALEAQFGESVLFIGGAFAIEPNILPEDPDPVPTVVVERTIVLPNDGRATVFLPLLNGVWNNLTNDPASNYTVEELKAQADFVFKPDGGLVSELFGFVDDKPVPDLFGHRQASGEAFYYNTPYPLDNSLLGKLGYNDESIVDNRDNLSSDYPPPIQIKDLAMGDKVTIGPSIADGYWAAVDVKGGSHTLHFGGTISFDGVPVFALDVTYNILNPIYGGNGKDNLNGTKGNDYIDGGDGSDKLMGLKGDDLIVGGDGSDVIDGGKGNDELWGDNDKDTFIFKRGYGQDTIFDFALGEKVEIPGLPVPPSLGVEDIPLPSGEDAAQINFGEGDILTFVGVQSSDLNIQRGLITFA